MESLVGYIAGQRSVAHGTLMSTADALAQVEAEAKAAPMREQLEDLQMQMRRVMVVVDALWSMLEEAGYSREDLRRRIGVYEAKAEAPEVTMRCRQCGAALPAGRATCQICGAEGQPEPSSDA
jgi:hypothetical protein